MLPPITSLPLHPPFTQALSPPIEVRSMIKDHRCWAVFRKSAVDTPTLPASTCQNRATSRVVKTMQLHSILFFVNRMKIGQSDSYNQKESSFPQNQRKSERQMKDNCLSIERQIYPKIHLFKKTLFQNLEKIILSEN